MLNLSLRSFIPFLVTVCHRVRPLVQLYAPKSSLSYTLSNISMCNNVLLVFLGVELKYKCTLNGHSAPVLACAFSCDGRMLVSG